MNSEPSTEKTFIVKNWHVALTLLLWLVTAVVSYATLRAQTDENSRRIQSMEEQHVRKDQFNELRDDLIRRLDSIDRKLDRERAIKELH